MYLTSPVNTAAACQFGSPPGQNVMNARGRDGRRKKGRMLSSEGDGGCREIFEFAECAV